MEDKNMTTFFEKLFGKNKAFSPKRIISALYKNADNKEYITFSNKLDSISILTYSFITAAIKQSTPLTYQELAWRLKLPKPQSIRSRSASLFLDLLILKRDRVDFTTDPFNPKILSSTFKRDLLHELKNDLIYLNRDVLYEILLKITIEDVANKRPPISLYVVDEDIILTPIPDKRFLLFLALNNLSVKYNPYKTENIIESYWKSRNTYLP